MFQFGSKFDLVLFLLIGCPRPNSRLKFTEQHKTETSQHSAKWATRSGAVFDKSVWSGWLNWEDFSSFSPTKGLAVFSPTKGLAVCLCVVPPILFISLVDVGKQNLPSAVTVPILVLNLLLDIDEVLG